MSNFPCSNWLMFFPLKFWHRMYYYSKYHECLDTILVVLRRGEVTFLALFHHGLKRYFLGLFTTIINST